MKNYGTISQVRSIPQRLCQELNPADARSPTGSVIILPESHRDKPTGAPHSGASPRDDANTPHISYQAWGSLRYARRDAGGWHSETVDTGNVSFTSLDLGADGSVHIAYVGGASGGSPMHARRAPDGWHLEIVDDDAPGFVTHTTLALDSQGTPHVGFLVQEPGTSISSSQLRYAPQTAQWGEVHCWVLHVLAGQERPANSCHLSRFEKHARLSSV